MLLQQRTLPRKRRRSARREEEARALPRLETYESVRGFGGRELPHNSTLLRFSRSGLDLGNVVGVKLRATSDALRVQGYCQCGGGG